MGVLLIIYLDNRHKPELLQAEEKITNQNKYYLYHGDFMKVKKMLSTVPGISSTFILVIFSFRNISHNKF